MKQILLKVSTVIIILGVMGLGINAVFGMNTVIYLQQAEINGVLVYKFNGFAYIENIYNTFTNVAELQLHLPTDEWSQTDNLSDIGNNLAYMFNRIIMVFNITLYPIRIIFYIIEIIVSLIGIPTQTGVYESNNLAWLVTIAKFLTNLHIPYVNQ